MATFLINLIVAIVAAAALNLALVELQVSAGWRFIAILAAVVLVFVLNVAQYVLKNH